MNGNEKTLLPPCSIEVDRTTWPLPPLVAHRGAGFLAPENTLKAFATAAAVGCLAVEFDVRLTIDGELVLSHDTELGRVIEGCGRIEELPAEELRKLKVRNLHRPDQSVANVCFLSEALQACSSLGLAMNVELKPVTGSEVALAERVASFFGQRNWLCLSWCRVFQPSAFLSFGKDVLKHAAAFCLKSRLAIGLKRLAGFRCRRFIRTKT